MIKVLANALEFVEVHEIIREIIISRQDIIKDGRNHQ
jgi:hypothetical protein